VVVAGLNNPRSLAIDQDGNLWVTEAGSGGPDCIKTPDAPNNPTCFGTTGSIDRVVGHHVDRVITGLVSYAAQNGMGAEGVSGISAWLYDMYVVFDESDQSVPSNISPALTSRLYDETGQLSRLPNYVSKPGLHNVANVGAYDYAWARNHKSLVPSQFPDANPYAVLARDSGFYVADAGANTLDWVSRNGNVRVLAFLPNPPSSDAVPTCLAQGPDGAIYVGQLTGDGNGPTAANVYRYTPSSGLHVWLSGFSAITGCGFGSDGSFYVTELDTNGFPPSGPSGAVVKIARDGTRTILGQGQLFFPNGFAAGPNGSIYVANWSLFPGTSSNGSPTGEVVRIG
jgi:sugar lactone lactonase YvrE